MEEEEEALHVLFEAGAHDGCGFLGRPLLLQPKVSAGGKMNLEHPLMLKLLRRCME